jgi:outer membrane receptor protein involved in Fe transport
VDTTTNSVSTNYDKDWVRNAPVPRFTFFDLINAAPGVNQAQTGDSRSTSLGSAGSENSYQLDGTDFTAPLTGAAWPWPNTDAIEEIEILSVGAPAEYGNLQGAVFNVVTRQGSNVWHGDANFYFQSDGLTDRNTTSEEDGDLPYTRDKYNDLTLLLSGPIVKDKLWFFGSYQYQRDYQSPVGVPAEFPNQFDADRVFGKINWQISANHKLMFAYHDDYYRIPCADTLCNALTAPSTIKVEHGHNPSPNVTYTATLSDKTLLEARVSGFYGKDHGDPLQEGTPRAQPRYLNLDTNEITGGIYSWYDGESWKTAASAKVSHFADDFLGGSHDFKFGVQYNQGGGDYLIGYNDYIRTYGGYPYYAYGYLAPGHTAGSTRGLGFFFDDSFRISDRFTLNFGLRYDYSKAYYESYDILDKDLNIIGSSPAVDKLYSWNSISPRIGFNWRLTKDGKTALKAHWGRYYGGMITAEFDDAAPSAPALIAFSGEYDEAGNRIGEEVISDNSNLEVDPGYDNPYTDQFVVSFERELARNLGLNITYINKRGENFGSWRDVGATYVPVTYVDDNPGDPNATGRSITVFRRESDPADSLFRLTNRPEMFSKVDAVTVQLQKRMADNWQATASVVYTDARGRLGSSNAGPIGSVASTAQRFGRDPNDLVNTDGQLVYDRPWTVKLQLVYMLPKGFLVGANFNYQQGRPWSRLIQVPSDLINRSSQILSEPLGDQRVGSWKLLDLRLQKEFGSGRARFALLADILNVFNNDANDSVGSRLGTSDSYGLRTDFVLPRRLMLGAKLNF